MEDLRRRRSLAAPLSRCPPHGHSPSRPSDAWPGQSRPPYSFVQRNSSEPCDKLDQRERPPRLREHADAVPGCSVSFCSLSRGQNTLDQTWPTRFVGHSTGNPDVATDPKPSRPCGSPRPPRAMPPGRLRSPPARLVRDRGLVPDALPAAARRAGGGHENEERAMPQLAKPAAGVGQTRAGRGGGTIAATSAAPKGRRSPSWPPAVPPDGQLSDRFMALSSSACTGSPLRCLSEASSRSLSHATARAGRSHAQLARQKLHRLVTL